MVNRVATTRMELSRQKKRLSTATRGHKLLKDKQDEMARQFMIYARKNLELRKIVESKLSDSMNKIAMVSAKMGEKQLSEALMVPMSSAKVETSSKNIMSVNVPVLKVKKSKQKTTLPYSFISSTGELDKAVLDFAEILPELLELAHVEKTCDMLSREMEKTRRRVNALEHVMIPQMKKNIKYITMKLDDNERSNITRLMKVKEMVIENR